MTEGKTGSRLRILTWVVMFMFAALTTRLWFLQVMASEAYVEAARENRVRPVPIPAPRGRIMDRNGKLLVRNRTSQVVTIRPVEVANAEELLLNLSEVLGIPPEELGERFDDPDYGPFQRIPVAVDVSEEDILYLAERKDEFPGVEYGLVGVRDYPNGSLAAHVLGYLGQIGPKELDTPRFEGYLPGQPVGRGGVEQAYEQDLHGKDGFQFVEVDARGKRIGQLRATAPREGDDVVLAIDRRIQKAAEEALIEGVKHAKGIYHEDSGKHLKAPAGAVVVLDPRNGEILAMASFPQYDPRVFLEGLTQREWARLNNPKKNYPLNNRAIQGRYPPGSTLKPFVAAAAVKTGLASTNGFYPCPEEFVVRGDTSKTVFRNWKDHDSGVISFGQALIESCDTVFYKFGLGFYRERKIRGEVLQQHLRAWGFDRKTGVDLPGELKGRVPDARWKALVHEDEPDLFPDAVWYPGDTINMSIGQGDLISTPLQLGQAFSALGNGGVLFKPHVALRVQDATGKVLRRIPAKVQGRLPYSGRLLRRIRGALQGVVSSGTGAEAFLGFPLSSVPVAGKTGTSEVPTKQPHSWFVAMAPADEPRYVAVAVVEEGGHGSEVAAPIVRRIFEHAFDIPVTPFRVGVASD